MDELLERIRINHDEWQLAQTKVDYMRWKIATHRVDNDLQNARDMVTVAERAEYLMSIRHELIFQLMTTVSYLQFKKLASISGGPWL